MLFTLLFGSMCSFPFDKASKLFCYGFNKEKLLEIDALRRLKMLLQRPYSSKSSGGARTWTSLAACALGTHDWPPQSCYGTACWSKSRLITIPKDKRVVDVVANANATFEGWGYDRLIALHKTPTFLALLSPKGDQNQFYPNNIWYVSHIRKKVIRIK